MVKGAGLSGWSAQTRISSTRRFAPFFRILLSFATKLQLSLDHFIQDDINTYYFVNGGLQKTYAVENNPSLLNYSLAEQERGKSAAQLFSQALRKVSFNVCSCFNEHFCCSLERNSLT